MRLIGLAVVLTVTLTLTSLAGEAQQAERLYRLGFLRNGTPTTQAHLFAAFRNGLEERPLF